MAEYNGWTNKETWLVNLWLGDSLAIDADSSMEITPEYIEELVDDLVDENVSEYGFVRDLINCALGEINWDEIASHYVREEEDV